MPMNGQVANQNGRSRREVDDFSVKLSTIRIWMHEKDIGKLTRILWAGQGNRLRQQASTNSKVKRFLAAVPYVMNSIKDVHQAVIDNTLETLQANLEPPVPPALITCRDANGLNVIHKAAGLGHTKILEYLVGIWPDGANEIDITGKTPLHWAASAKNNMRCYTLLTQAGCDEEAVDYKMKTPSYYRHKPHEIERAFLVYVPEAPRVSPDIPTDWEALSEDNSEGKKLDIKIPESNGFNGRTTDESIENTSEVDLNDGVSANDEEEEISHDGDAIANIENGKQESLPATPEKEVNAPEEEEQETNEHENENDKEPVAAEQEEAAADEENNTNAINETGVTELDDKGKMAEDILENGHANILKENQNGDGEDNESEIKINGYEELDEKDNLDEIKQNSEQELTENEAKLQENGNNVADEMEPAADKIENPEDAENEKPEEQAKEDPNEDDRPNEETNYNDDDNANEESNDDDDNKGNEENNNDDDKTNEENNNDYKVNEIEMQVDETRDIENEATEATNANEEPRQNNETEKTDNDDNENKLNGEDSEEQLNDTNGNTLNANDETNEATENNENITKNGNTNEPSNESNDTTDNVAETNNDNDDEKIAKLVENRIGSAAQGSAKKTTITTSDNEEDDDEVQFGTL